MRNLIKKNLRIVSSILPLFILPKIVSHSDYSFFLKNYYFFIAIFSILLSPIEHVMIISSQKNYYKKIINSSIFLIMIVFIFLLILELIFFGLSFFKLGCLFAGGLFFLNNNIKLKQIDNHYYLSDFIVQLISLVLTVFFIPFKFYPWAISFFYIFFIIYYRFDILRINSFKNFKFTYRLFYKVFITNYPITFVHGFIKNIDNLAIKFLLYDPKLIIMYRFVKSAMNFVLFINSLKIQDYWITRMDKNFIDKFSAYFILSFIFVSILAYSYYIEITLTYFDLLILITTLIFINYILRNTKYSIDIYINKKFKMIKKYTYLSALFVLLLSPFLNTTIFMLLFVIYLSHAINIYFISRYMRENFQE